MGGWWRRIRERTSSRWGRWRRKRARLRDQERKRARRRERRGGRPDGGDDITRYGDPFD
jgi:hypothetical protein